MLRTAAIAFVFAMLLVGCATPIPVKNSPTFVCHERSEDGFLQYDRSGNTIDKACNPPIEDAANFNDLIRLYSGYYQTYIMEAKAKRLAGQNASEVSFYGAVVGILGGMANSTATAIAGGTVAAGGQLMSERYRHQVQAVNYELAADAMLCMYIAAKDIGVDFTDSRTSYRMFNQPSDVALRDIGRDGLLRVKDKLYRLQSRFELGRPDPSLLKQSLASPPEEPKKPDPAKNNQLMGIFNAHTDKTSEDTPSARAAANFKNKIDECYSKMGG